MDRDFVRTTFGKIGSVVHRLGLSASYRPGKAAVYKALDEGINLFFCFGIDTQMISVLRDVLKNKRENYVVATGAYNYIWWHQNLRRTLEKRLRQLDTDYIDAFLFFGVLKEKEFTPRLRDDLSRLREEGKVRGVGISAHNRQLAGQLAAQDAVDLLMIRYSAAQRGAEQEIFPYLAPSTPGVISYIATRWGSLLRRPRGWPKDAPIPDAGMCYRFVLSNPHVHVDLTAPSNLKQLEENQAAIRQGPLSEEERQFMHRFGDAVHHARKWFA